MPESDPVFAAFCAVGLWPGLGRVLTEALPEAGILGPDDVNPTNLAALPKVGTTRANRLLSSWIGVAHLYQVAQLLVPAGLPARLASRAVDTFGDDAARLLRDDPWRLLELADLKIVDVDRLAVQVIPGVRRDDPRRGRALVGYVLARAARDGHTVQPAAVVLGALEADGVPNPPGAVAAACESGLVLAHDPATDPAHDPATDPAGTPGPEFGPDHGPAGADPAGNDRPDRPGGPRQAGAAGASGAADGEMGAEPGGVGGEPGGAGGGTLLALERYAIAEDGIAEAIARLAATAKPIEPVGSAGGTDPTEELDSAQRAAVEAALAHGVSVLTGGPGTGKSRTVAAIVTLADAAGQRVALAAPTGRAAKRLSELCDAEASTLHRLLGAQGMTGEFARNEAWPLDADLVVVDETSMLDVELAAALLDACADGTHLLLVGDPAQLPSIGAGRVLADLLDSGVAPVTELTTLYRQAEGGAIARLATAVRGGELPKVDSPDREVVIVGATGSGEAAHRTVQLVTDSIPRALGIPAGEVQVVTPVHRGPAGTIELNRALKAKLNPGTGGGSVAGFDPGDRVVATANHLELDPVGFANGEVGVVTGTGDGAVTVEFAAGPAKVSGRALGDLRHGWAITVHRAQGSEWPAVVVVMPPEASGMLSRPLVYTALTRAQRHLSVVHAAGGALARAVREVGARPRRTRLRELLLAADADGPDGPDRAGGG
ncbi:MAG TPA: AAA family ATPase [Mycobacteriales bacterium]|nr:AAA family ATPase [Mycobacteriales bacterium]